jgi:hypothetical protein
MLLLLTLEALLLEALLLEAHPFEALSSLAAVSRVLLARCD